jgi:hypothetical protein
MKQNFDQFAKSVIHFINKMWTIRLIRGFKMIPGLGQETFQKESSWTEAPIGSVSTGNLL